MKYILSIDQGTTSSRAILFNQYSEILGVSQQPFTQIFPKPGWVEHDATEIWNTQASVIKDVIEKNNISANQIAALGITNQRETTVVWDRKTGKPIYNAIVWQDRRTSDYCQQLKKEGYSNTITNKTGLVIDAYFSATKLKWILDNVEGARSKANKGELCFGTIDSWLVWNLTNGLHHITDVTNASRTMLFNIHTLEWDDELLQIFGIPRSMLPSVHSCSDIYGYTNVSFIDHPVAIGGIAGDQQAALFGQLCLEEGMLKTTYGTGCFMVMNTGKKPIRSKNNLLTTIGWKIGDEVTYALEGSVFVGGAAIQWLRDELHLFANAAETEQIACSIPDNGGVYFVPALTGLGAPYWDQYARGAIIGITRGTNSAHITRAALEGIAYQVDDVLSSMCDDVQHTIKEMRVDGGAVANNFMMQFQADISQSPVIRPVVLETTALGAAYFAGLAVGYWKSVEELKDKWTSDKRFTPSIPKENADILLNQWHKAVSRSLNWSNE